MQTTINLRSSLTLFVTSFVCLQWWQRARVCCRFKLFVVAMKHVWVVCCLKIQRNRATQLTVLSFNSIEIETPCCTVDQHEKKKRITKSDHHHTGRCIAPRAMCSLLHPFAIERVAGEHRGAPDSARCWKATAWQESTKKWFARATQTAFSTHMQSNNT